jgi:hypothetical protein
LASTDKYISKLLWAATLFLGAPSIFHRNKHVSSGEHELAVFC